MVLFFIFHQIGGLKDMPNTYSMFYKPRLGIKGRKSSISGCKLGRSEDRWAPRLRIKRGKSSKGSCKLCRIESLSMRWRGRSCHRSNDRRGLEPKGRSKSLWAIRLWWRGYGREPSA
jgi:hypothetical protein